MLRGTRGRLAVSSVVVLAVALAVVDAVALASLWAVSMKQADAVLVDQTGVVSPQIQDPTHAGGIDPGDLPDESRSGVAVAAAVVEPSGSLITTQPQPLSASTLRSLAAAADRSGQPVWVSLTDRNGTPRRVYATRLVGPAAPGTVLVVSRSVGELMSNVRQTAMILAGASLLVLVIGAFLAYRLPGRALRPVRTIAGLARSLSEHDLHRRVEVAVPEDELGELVGTFNAMLGRLEAAFESLRRFTADAAHELRTPLTLLRAEIEGSLSRSLSGAEQRRLMETLRDEVIRLSRLADQLLLLAQADAGALRLAPEPLDVADFVNEVGARWDATAARRDVRVVVAAPEGGSVSADPAMVRRLLDNLIDNGVRHAGPRTDVVLRAYRSNGGWNFDVSDRGPGVAAEFREHLFTRFARSDGARSPEGGGAGLGLALSAAIAEAHQGWLRLVANGAGATFRLHLPDRAEAAGD